MNPVPKPELPYENKDYLLFIAQHPCDEKGCKTPMQSVIYHHVRLYDGGWGQKPDDTQSVPRCFNCHIPITHNGKGKSKEETIIEIVELQFEYITIELDKLDPLHRVRVQTEIIKMLEGKNVRKILY